MKTSTTHNACWLAADGDVIARFRSRDHLCCCVIGPLVIRLHVVLVRPFVIAVCRVFISVIVRLEMSAILPLVASCSVCDCAGYWLSRLGSSVTFRVLERSTWESLNPTSLPRALPSPAERWFRRWKVAGNFFLWGFGEYLEAPTSVNLYRSTYKASAMLAKCGECHNVLFVVQSMISVAEKWKSPIIGY